jgi:hypothetical protein
MIAGVAVFFPATINGFIPTLGSSNLRYFSIMINMNNEQLILKLRYNNYNILKNNLIN